MPKLSILLLAAPTMLAGIATPAAAQDQSRSAIVRYGDLNLASEDGRARFETRVRRAIEEVCESRPHYRPTLAQVARAQECEAAASRDAEVKIAEVLSDTGVRLAGGSSGISISAR